MSSEEEFGETKQLQTKTNDIDAEISIIQNSLVDTSKISNTNRI